MYLRKSITSANELYVSTKQPCVFAKKTCVSGYGVATMSRMLENTGLFAEYRSLL
jgi:hypothetical protein